MIKVILFDCDGPIIKRDKYFSQRMQEESSAILDLEKQNEFFTGVFLECEIGKADLKEVLPHWFPAWSWKGSVDEFLHYWFSGEAKFDSKMTDYVASLRKIGIKCHLSTNQEKYRSEYLWSTVGLKNFFDGIYSSCNLGYMKPQLEFWEKIHEDLGEIPKAEVLVLDDDLDNVESAKQFGFNAEFYKNFEDFKKIMSQSYKL